jgi:hypothetical protein
MFLSKIANRFMVKLPVERTFFCLYRSSGLPHIFLWLWQIWGKKNVPSTASRLNTKSKLSTDHLCNFFPLADNIMADFFVPDTPPSSINRALSSPVTVASQKSPPRPPSRKKFPRSRFIFRSCVVIRDLQFPMLPLNSDFRKPRRCLQPKRKKCGHDASQFCETTGYIDEELPPFTSKFRPVSSKKFSAL